MNTQSQRHELKIDLEYYEAVAAGAKTFEIRKNDRDFKVDDVVVLRAYNREAGHFYPDYPAIFRQIKYITNYAQQESYVVFSI